MSLNKEHIDLKRLEDYFQGKMSPEEMHALEMEAQQDPFLYEAMEGYESHPEGLKRVSEIQQAKGKGNQSFFGKTILGLIGVVALVFLVAQLVSTEVQEPVREQITTTDTASYEEVEVVREEIDTFIYAEESEQITPEEIQNSKSKIHESNEKLAEQIENQKPPEIINVEEKPVIENENEIIPENVEQTNSVYAPHIYQYDMKVVDYRDIDRENEVIKYTRYEFTGLSAEFEDELARENAYDRQTEVEVPYLEYLERSMYYFSKRQYKKALNRYLTIMEQYPKDLNAHFYGALCYYDMKQYDKALALFSQLQTYEKEEGFVAFRQEAKWYQAKTLIKLGRINETKKILDEIIIEGLFYSQDAIKLRATL